jgi:acyl carrier protein
MPLQQSIDIAAIQSRCARGVQTFDDANHHPFLDFGARWRVLKSVAYGEREALIRLDMPVEFRDELNVYGLHPAVLDMATAGAQIIVDGYQPDSELYVPIGYRRLQFNGRLPDAGFSHVIYCPTDNETDDIQFDVSVCDDNGAVCLLVQGFTMRRIADVNSFRKALPVASDDVNPSLKRTLELGINDEEGMAALLAVVQRQLAPQTIVSAYRLDYLQRELLSLVLPPEPIAKSLHDADADPAIATIETLLQECPAVEIALVRSFLDESEERRLVAFFVPDFDHFVTQGELRRFARDRLPAAHVPQYWVELDEIPRDTAGSIDRSGLFDPLAPKDHYLAPRTSIEKNLARIWQDALGVERAGLSDNFFDLGGHSLLSTRVIVQIYKKLGIRLDQATMVLHTLEQIAREISEKTGVATDVNSIAENSQLDSVAPHTLQVEVKVDKKKGRLQSLLFGGKK